MTNEKSCLDIDNTITPTQEKLLLEAYHYISPVVDVEKWEKLWIAFNHWTKVDQRDLKIIKDTFVLFLGGMALFDDIANESEFRKGLPAAHLTFGIPNTLNAYYYASSIASIKLLDLENDNIMQPFTQNIMNLARARRTILYWKEHGICPTEEEYIKMVLKLTNPQLQTPVQFLQILSEYEGNISRLAQLLSVYFYVLQEYQRASEDIDSGSKTFAIDVTQGNYTFPIIHLIHRDEDDGETVLEILRKRTKDVELKKYVIQLMNNHGSLKYTVEKLKELKEEIVKEAKKQPPNPLMDQFIADYMTI